MIFCQIFQKVVHLFSFIPFLKKFYFLQIKCYIIPNKEINFLILREEILIMNETTITTIVKCKKVRVHISSNFLQF